MSNRTWIVGSSPDCDLRVEAPTVSAQHCRLTECVEGYLLEDLGSSNGTLVGGQRIASPTIVRRDDMITLGKTVALPWPPSSTSITIGRSSENDLVVDFDAVSSTHARLEREGNRYYLVDLGSTNGTAVHTPTNKISRAPITPKDTVFFGSHCVSAAELIASLPRDVPRAATVLESSPLNHSIFEGNEPSDEDSAGESTSAVPEGFRSTKSWLVGIAASVLCVCIIFGGKRLVSSGVDSHSNSSIAEDTVASSGGVRKIPPKESQAAKNHSTGSIDLSLVPDESVIRAAEPSLGLLGLRLGGTKAYLTRVTAWSFAPNLVICPTEMLVDLDGVREKQSDNTNVDIALSIFRPERHVAILDYKNGEGPAAGFSLVRLEGPLEAACDVNGDTPVPVVPGQQLAMLGLIARTQDIPDSVECEFVRLTLDRIERDTDGIPKWYYCRPEEVQGEVSGAPIFDAAGNLVGCVVQVIQEEVAVDGDGVTIPHEIVIMPIDRLATLLELNP